MKYLLSTEEAIDIVSRKDAILKMIERDDKLGLDNEMYKIFMQLGEVAAIDDYRRGQKQLKSGHRTVLRIVLAYAELENEARLQNK